ncbi:hypothetical protein DR60_4338 [Burkholderia pseudomallei]|nr:hypothetical protein DR60_4338 [Burkholderia pseudomallei]
MVATTSDSEEKAAGGHGRPEFCESGDRSVADATEGPAYCYDTKVSGLAIGAGPSGIKAFILYRKANRKQERIKIGRYPDRTVDETRTQAWPLIVDIAR